MDQIVGAMVPKKDDKKLMYLPQQQSLLCGPVQPAYSKTEKVEEAESGVCRVFDRVPVAAQKKNGYE